MPKTLSQSELDQLIQKCSTQDQKSFTKTLRDLEREFGRTICLFEKEGRVVFEGCCKIFTQYDDPIIQYNALRLAKYAVDTPGSLENNFQDPWALYLLSIFHKDGRLRMAGIQLFDRYYFGLAYDLFPVSFPGMKKRKINKEHQEAIGRFIIEKFYFLQDLENRYMEEHGKYLKKNDLPDHSGKMPWASDTKDQQLKTIRMGLEVFYLKGPLEKLLKKYGVKAKHSNEFLDIGFFYRYESYEQK